MIDSEYNRLVELRNKCYQDRMDRETDITYFTGFNDGYEKGKESLAEENAELERKLEQTEKDLADYQFNYPTIKKLEKENTDLRDNYDQFKAIAEPVIERLKNENAELKAELKAIDEAAADARKHITESFRNKKSYWELEKDNIELREELNYAETHCLFHSDCPTQKENADLKCECRRCVYTDSPCVLSDYGKDRNGICDHFKDVFDENAELRENNKMLEQGYVWHDYDAGEDCYEYSHEGKWVKRDEVYQLAKAKELLKKLYEETRGYMNDQGFDMNVINEVYDFINSEVEK